MEKPEPLKQITNVKTGSDEIERALRETLVIYNQKGIPFAVEKLKLVLESLTKERVAGFAEWINENAMPHPDPDMWLIGEQFDKVVLSSDQLYNKYLEFLKEKE